MAELERHQPDQILINGDIINAVPNSNDVVERVRPSDWLVTRGNHEFYYLNYGTEHDVPNSNDRERWGQLHWLVKNLKPEHGRYLAGLPDELTLLYPHTQPLRVTHGSPGHHRWGFYEGQPRQEILQFLDPVSQPTLVSAHTHVQLDWMIESDGRHTDDDFYIDPHAYGTSESTPGRRWHVINPGSVGMPLNSDVRAQFCLLQSTDDPAVWGGWQATHYRIPYDRRPVLESYFTSGMLEQGGVISILFYWEIVTADREISLFFHWAEAHFDTKQTPLREMFNAYVQATARDQYILEHDPYKGQLKAII